MSHIEFIGPPGSGKSTIHHELLNNKFIHGGICEDALYNIFIGNSELRVNVPKKFRLIYQISPSFLKSIYEDVAIQHYIRRNAFTEFLKDFPDYLDIIKDALNSVSHEKKEIVDILRGKSEEYKIGISTMNDNQVLCLDEGFAMGAVSVLWREEKRNFSLKKYFEAIPTPDKIIYVKAPIEKCLERQKNRERITVNKKWGEPKKLQEKHSKVCNEVLNYLEKNGVEKIKINNDINANNKLIKEIVYTLNNELKP
ncbi:AAA family ATPase [Methanonatronarchaeum sp. AMET6-2]|uniref:AAA family ATPase n=1 Tax=Methanonatronarchaeum sp. AMET6-2 TaxID=2933293 RepID=UPI001FF38B6A|nr:AAA family ATPase [Methanonatronarchaeum sp. AMET6-2]UOY10290.1 deoxynucleoside kinase [Methanonatronarchaeum sp. AMET6-2]